MHSLFRAAFIEAGRVYKVEPWSLAFWHAVFACLILLPVLPFAAWPMDGRFYFAAIVVALIMAVGTLVQLNLAGRRKGRVSSIYMPLEACAAFLIWIAITPAAFDFYAHTVGLAIWIVASFVTATIAILRIRPQDISLETLSLVAPIGITYAMVGVITKLAMPPEATMQAALVYVFVTFLAMAIFTGIILRWKKKKPAKIEGSDAIRAGIVTGAFSAISFMTFVGGVAFAANPGYISLIAMLLPVWMLAFHKMVRVPDKAHEGAAYMLVIAVVILIAAATAV
jgi:hypothetical protein